MEYGRIPGIDKDISRLVQGAIMINAANEAERFPLFDAIFAAGCTTYDLAHVYGNGECERGFGHWMNSRGIRDQLVLLDKGAHHNADRRRVTPFDITADLFDSLARLGTEYIDLYVLHRDDPSAPVGPIVEVLNEHKAAGRIRAFGGSNWTTARLEAANEYAAAHGLTPFVVSSPHFSLAEQIAAPWDDCLSITGQSNAAARDWYRRTQFPLFCWSSLAGGWFSGQPTRAYQGEHAEELCLHCYGCEGNWERLARAELLGRERGLSAAQVALAYVFHQGYNVFPLVAAYTPEEFLWSAAAVELVLTPEELAWLDLRAACR